MPTFVSPFTGDIVQPTDVSYLSLSFSTDQVLVWPNYAVPGATTVAAARIIDCIPSTPGLIITLPPGNQASVGTDILFRNKGAVPFIVQDISGGQSVTIVDGGARYFYLIDNSTLDGQYSNVAFGAGTSIADAASLVGNGLTNQAGRLETSTDVIETALSPSFDEESRAKAYVWNGGAGTFTLPNPATLAGGWFIMIRNSGTGSLTVDTATASLIDGNSNVTFFPSDSATIVFDEDTGNFFTVGLTRQSATSYSSATYDVDSIVGSTLSLVTYAPNIQTYVAFSGTRTTNLTVELPAITQLYVVNNQTGSGAYSIEFQITGSLGSTVTIGDNVTAMVLSDGTNLSILASQTGTGTFLASNGTVLAPSYSFNSDTGVGMYLIALNALGFAANGISMLELDATNFSSPKVSTPAEFTAGLISGGSF